MRFALCLMFLFVSSAPARAQSGVPSRESLARVGLERVWVSQARLDAGRNRVTHVYADERNVYVHGTNGTLTAFDSESGRRRWAIQLGPAGRRTFRPVSNDKVVILVTGTKVFGVDKFSGSVVWTAKMPAAASTSPAIDEDFFYVGTLDGSIYAFNFAVVEYHHRTGRLPGYFDPREGKNKIQVSETASAVAHLWMWRYRTGRRLSHPPARTGAHLLLADDQGTLYGVLSEGLEARGKLRFQYDSGGSIAADISARGEIAYVPTSNHQVLAINVRKGSRLWNFAAGRKILEKPLPIGDRIYVVSENEGLVAISAESGDPVRTNRGIWWVPGATQFVAASKSFVLASDRSGNLTAVSLDNAAQKGSVPLAKFTHRYSNELTDRVYLSTESGLVICLREKGATEPLFHRDLDRAPINPEISDEEAPAEPAEQNPAGSGA